MKTTLCQRVIFFCGAVSCSGAFVLAQLGPNEPAPVPASSPTVPLSERRETLRLLPLNMPFLSVDPPGTLTLPELQLTYKPSLNPSSSEELEEQPDGTLALKPFVVGATKITFEEPKETVLEKFIRTGTISQHVGKKVTTRLWMKGDEGIMLRFSW